MDFLDILESLGLLGYFKFFVVFTLVGSLTIYFAPKFWEVVFKLYKRKQ
jgi:hypothetical protein